jgi:hypothetical protein
MLDQTTEQELNERLKLIENMIAEGRRNTESWGWTFILWGVAYYVALAWSRWANDLWAWPASALIAAIVTAVASIWTAFGISMFLLFPALGLSGRLTDLHLFLAVLSAILGMANGASALILRWRVQLACALVWWSAALFACFGTDTQSTIAFLAAVFLCQIAFGVYGVIAEARQRKRRGSSHA